MRILVQRVIRAEVRVEGKLAGSINKGILGFVGVGAGDTFAEADHLATKLVELRLFSDSNGKMNASARDIGADVLLVSQFTLYGDCSKGRRPSFDAAAPPGVARAIYDYFVQKVRAQGLRTETGVFQAHMEVELINDGPVTFLLER